MFSLVAITALLIICTNSCSPPMPIDGKYYISNTQLLSVIDYPDSLLLTIRKSSGFPRFNPVPLPISPISPVSPVIPVPVIDNGPWCKIMNVNTGSVGNVVSCSDYNNKIRNYATPDTKSTTVLCKDNCDGSTAKCTITRNGVTHSIDNIRYLASSVQCINNIQLGGIFISFTIINNNIETTYISFATNMIAIEWNDNISPISYTIYDVDREGDWDTLIPGGWFAEINRSPSVYSDINIIKVALPCCICHSYRLITYSITTNTVDMTQVFTLTELGWGGGQIDAVKSRVFNNGLFYSDTLTVYDLSRGGVANSFKPNLCNFMARCRVEPCSDLSLKCTYNPTARCVNDYCGGCNAKWYVLYLYSL